ncbi:hypothetical protein [Celeribacter sp. ULVN23_4]
MKLSVLSAIAMLVAAPVLAQGTQPYTPSVQTFVYSGTTENYCPAGLQPIVELDGVACGRPSAS